MNKLIILVIVLFFIYPNLAKTQGTLVDIDGNSYATIEIGDQEWMAENLRTKRYSDGTSIPTELSRLEWSEAKEGAFAIYPHNRVDNINSDSEMVDAYGKLYNWYAVVDRRELCPDGWRVPTDVDWRNLFYYLMTRHMLTNDPEDVEGIGNALKSCRQVESPKGVGCDVNSHPRWNESFNHFGTDKFGFSALPAGGRYAEGSFNHLGDAGLWWSTTDNSDNYALGRMIGYYFGGVYRYSGEKNIGFSVRCIKE